MTAFDGKGQEVSVFFDSDGNEVNLGIVDIENYERTVAIEAGEVPVVISDLLDAHTLRTGSNPAVLIAQLIRERNISIEDAVRAYEELGETLLDLVASPQSDGN